MTVTPLTTIAYRDDPAAAAQAGVPALFLRGDVDAIGEANGDLAIPRLDEEGRVKVSTKPASIDSVSGAVTAVAGVVNVDVHRASNVVFHVKNTGTVTLAAGTFVFEGSIDSTNGTNGTWFGVQAVRSNANTIETSIALSGITAAAGYAASWEASVNGYTWFRIRCTVAVTASAVATWTVQRGSYATEPIPAAQISGTQPVSGSVTATATPATPSTTTTLTTASTNATAVKASAGTLYGLVISNPTATACYVRLYNKASGPTPATDSALVMATVLVPASSTVNPNLGALGLRFATGIAFTVTGAIADTDATNAVAGVRVLSAYL